MHDAAAGSRRTRLNSEIGEAGNDFFKPVKIEIGDGTAEGDAKSDAPSEEYLGGDQGRESEHDHEAPDAVEGTGGKVVLTGIRFGGIH